MYIHFKIYRTGKHKNDIIDTGIIQYNLNNDSEILILRELIYKLLNQYTSELDVVKHNGTAYVGKVEILFVEITDEDNITTPENAFDTYRQTELSDIYFKWSKQNTIQPVPALEYKGKCLDKLEDDLSGSENNTQCKQSTGKENSKTVRGKKNS